MSSNIFFQYFPLTSHSLTIFIFSFSLSSLSARLEATPQKIPMQKRYTLHRSLPHTQEINVLGCKSLPHQRKVCGVMHWWKADIHRWRQSLCINMESNTTYCNQDCWTLSIRSASIHTRSLKVIIQPCQEVVPSETPHTFLSRRDWY